MVEKEKSEHMSGIDAGFVHVQYEGKSNNISEMPRAALEEKMRLLEKDNKELSSILANLPAGICEVKLDNNFTLLHGNRAFFSLYKYKPQQMKDELENHLVNAILHEDLPYIKEAVFDSFAAGKSGFEAEHRIIRRDSTIIWALIKGNFSTDRAYTTVQCVIVDITERKMMEQDLKINEERFRVALEQMDNTIFDYNIATRVMIHAYKSADMYGLGKETENVPESLVGNGTIHPNSAEPFLEMYEKIRAGAPKASSVVQTHLVAGRYVWRKITMTNIFDSEGKAVRAVGILEDIDEQKRREDLLRNQLERDALTGLYNKGATEARIQGCLTGTSEEDADGALYIIDIDEFKGVNDRYGHLYGDKVLSESARRIAALFYSDDIIGRIGGDEFAVFVKSFSKKDAVYQKAQEICNAFTKEFSFSGIIAKISCSVGCTIFSSGSIIFEELYQKADIALYDAKRSGKNCFSMFSRGMGGGLEWTPYSSTVIDLPESASGC